MKSVSVYRGMSPRTSARALPENMAQLAINCRMLSGDLEAWNDIADVFSLVKSGPTNTMSLMAGKYWLNWGATEIAAGFTNVDVARLPIVGDTTYKTIYTGTGSPRITDLQSATGGSTSPNGPYPIADSPLAVAAPGSPPTAVNVPGSQGNTVTTTSYVSDFSTWYTGKVGGAYVTWTVMNTVGNSALTPPQFHGDYQSPNLAFAQAPSTFSFSTSVSFALDFDISPDIVNSDQSPNGFVKILCGSLVGACLALNFRDGNTVTWLDEIAGQTTPTVLASSAVDQHHGYHVHIAATNNGVIDSAGTRTFTVGVTVTRLSDSVVVASASNLTATYGGESTNFGGRGGSGTDVQNIYIARVAFSVTASPSLFVPVYSNYVYTFSSSNGFESSASAASNTVQVDNGSINTVTIPTLPSGQDVQEIYLYRAATGSTGTQYEQVPNPNTSDGGFPVCTVGGTANAITLATPDGAAPTDQTYYFFTATATNTGGVTGNLNGSGAKSVVDTSGAALGSGAITLGGQYTLVYQRPQVKESSTTSPSGQKNIALTDTSGISVGNTVSDVLGAVPVGATVTAVNAGVSVQLSSNLVADISAGDLITFANTSGKFTLLTGFTFVDALPTADLGDPLPSANFDTPPSNLNGILSLPNNTICGFAGNSFYLSAQGYPQAFPLSYALATDSQIVGLGAIGTTVLILTDSHPYTAYGATPDAYTMTKEDFIQGCVSKRSISYLRGYGICYASTDGIYAYAGHGIIKNLTEPYFTFKEWNTLKPSSIIGIVHQGLYFFWYDSRVLSGSGTEGTLTPNQTVFTSSTLQVGCNPVISPNGGFLYAGLNGSGGGTTGYRLYQINQTTGALTVLSGPNKSSSGSFRGNMVIHPNAKFLYVCNSSLPNQINILTLDASTGAILTQGAQATTNAVSWLAISNDGLFLYATDTASGTIHVYSINQSTGALTSVSDYTGMSSAGSTPQFSSDGSFLYTCTSSNVDVASVNKSTGALTRIQSVGHHVSTGASIKLTPSGAFLYVAGAGSGGNGAVSYFTVNTTTGMLTYVTVYSSIGTNLSGNGGILITADSKVLMVNDGNNYYTYSYSINTSTGALTLVSSYFKYPGINAFWCLSSTGGWLYAGGAQGGGSSVFVQYIVNGILLSGEAAGYILDPNPNGFGLTKLDFHAIAAALDTSSDSLYLALDVGTITGSATPATNELCQWDAAATKRAYTWKSKLWQEAYPTTYQFCRLFAADYNSLSLSLFADNTNAFATLSPKTDREFLVPPKQVREFSFQLSGTSAAQPIQFTETAEELFGS